MIAEHYIWLVWSSAFLLPWLAAYAAFPPRGEAMLWANLFKAPFGLTEPLLVPVCWSPPSLFDFARTTELDIKSLTFCFGLGVVLYNLLPAQCLQAVPIPNVHLHATDSGLRPSRRQARAAKQHQHSFRACCGPLQAQPRKPE